MGNGMVGSALPSFMTLPFVNREEQLRLAAGMLFMRQAVASGGVGADIKRAGIVFCAQMFGTGKTTFGAMLSRCMNEAYDGRLVHSVFDALKPGRTVDESMRDLVMAAARKHGLRCASSSPRSLTAALNLVQAELEQNEKDEKGKTPTQLFLHIDEFDMDDRSGSVVLVETLSRFRFATDRAYHVWLNGFLPILRTPNVHLFVSGRSPVLSSIGFGAGQSPMSATHIMLGGLSSDHMQASLSRLLVGGVPVLDYLGLRADGDGDAALRKAAFLRGLHSASAGVPRLVALTLSEVFRTHGAPGALQRMAPDAIEAIFAPDGEVVRAVSLGPYVKPYVEDFMKSLDSSDEVQHRAAVRDFKAIFPYLSSLPAPVGLAASSTAELVEAASRACAYVEFSAPYSMYGTIPEGTTVVYPSVVQRAFRDAMKADAAHDLSDATAPADADDDAHAAGAVFENKMQAALEYQLWAAEVTGAPRGPLKELINSVGIACADKPAKPKTYSVRPGCGARVRRVNVVFEKPRAGARSRKAVAGASGSDAADTTLAGRLDVMKAAPRVYADAALRDRLVLFRAAPMSHAPDLALTFPLDPPYASGLPLSHAFIGLSLKSTECGVGATRMAQTVYEFMNTRRALMESSEGRGQFADNYALVVLQHPAAQDYTLEEIAASLVTVVRAEKAGGRAKKSTDDAQAKAAAVDGARSKSSGSAAAGADGTVLEREKQAMLAELRKFRLFIAPRELSEALIGKNTPQPGSAVAGVLRKIFRWRNEQDAK